MVTCQHVKLLDFVRGFPVRLGFADAKPSGVGVLIDDAFANRHRRDFKLVLLQPFGGGLVARA